MTNDWTLHDVVLPWEQPLLPEYRPGHYGRWVLSTTTGRMPGYFTPTISEMDVPALRRRENGKEIVWMSLARMEIESHMPHIEAAHGHTVVMGLGMGFYLYNIIRKPSVRRVTVIERDPSVLALLRQISDYDRWPGIEKVQVIIADARSWKTSEHVDFLYADFWKRLADKNALPYTKSAIRNIDPVRFGYWTQEFDFVDYLRLNSIRLVDADSYIYSEFVAYVNEGNEGPLLVGQFSNKYALLSVIAVIIQTIVGVRHDPMLVDHLGRALDSYITKYRQLDQ